MSIFLFRHGESTGDVQQRYGGWYDDDLSERGKHQVEDAISEIQKKNIQIIVTSSLRRARQSAEIIARTLQIGFAIQPDLKEQNFYGVLSGMTFDEAQKKYPEYVSVLYNRTSFIPEREPTHLFNERFDKALYSLDTTKNILVVTHGGPIRHVFRELLNMGELQEVDDCALIQLEKDEKNQLKLIGQTGITFPS